MLHNVFPQARGPPARGLDGQVMRILLTGATGYIGSVVCDALVRAGHDVTALVRNPAKARRLAQSVQLLHADLAEPGAYRDRIAGFDAYVHTAIDTSARAAEVDRKAIETMRDIAWRSSRAVFI